VRVSTNGGAHWGLTSGNFSYEDAVVLTALRPQVAPAGADAPFWISLEGEGLESLTASLVCRLVLLPGTIAVMVPGELHEHGSVRCPLPARLAAGRASIAVSANGGADWSEPLALYLEAAPTALSLSPEQGPESGGTRVAVRVLGLPPRASFASAAATGVPALLCRFGEFEATPAEWLSETAVVCTTPAAPAINAELPLNLSRDGQYWVAAPRPFKFFSVPTLVALEPATAYQHRRQLLAVRGSGFPLTAQEPLCRFEQGVARIAVMGRAISATRVDCPVPAVPRPGMASLALSFNGGADWTASALSLHIVSEPGRLEVSPASGPARGGTSLLLSGLPAAAATETAMNWTCEFRFDATPPVVLRVAAAAPARGVGGLSCVSPPAPSVLENATALVVLMRADSDSSPLGVGQFAFYLSPLVSQTTPRSRTETGPMSFLRVTGSGFRDSTELVCRLVRGAQRLSLSATYENEEAVSCLVPAQLELAPGVWSVEVSNNGVDFVSGATSESFFNVLPRLSPSRVEPAASVLRLGSPTTLTIQLTSSVGFAQEDPVVCLFAAVIAQPLEGAAVHFPSRSWLESAGEAADRVVRCPVPRSTRAGQWRVAVTRTSALSRTRFPSELFEASLALELLHAPSVRGVLPLAAPLEGGKLTLLGNFPPGSTARLACRFGSGQAGPSGVSRGTMLQLVAQDGSCIAPPGWAAAPGWGALLVLDIESGEAAGPELPLQAYASPTLAAPLPVRGSARGGNDVFLTAASGSVFPRYLAGKMRCRFGDAPIVAARWVNETMLACRAPAHAPGEVRLAVSLNGGADFSFGATYSFEERETVTGVSPTSGSARGGTLVEVRGTNLLQGALECRFGARVVPARVDSSTRAVCQAPPLAVAAEGLPAAAARAVDLAVGDATVRFEYLADVDVLDVRPRFAAKGLATPLVLATTAVADTLDGRLECRFGSLGSSPATRVGSNTVTCSTPVAAAPDAYASLVVPLELVADSFAVLQRGSLAQLEFVPRPQLTATTVVVGELGSAGSPASGSRVPCRRFAQGATALRWSRGASSQTARCMSKWSASRSCTRSSPPPGLSLGAA
jgi:hypothetical protein